MRRIRFCRLVVVLVLANGLPVWAQQPVPNMPRIGVLVTEPILDAVQGLAGDIPKSWLRRTSAKFEMIVNLKGSKQSGLTISPNVLVRADRVIR
jgi:hypothetical protein